jgi:hypothetical protein
MEKMRTFMVWARRNHFWFLSAATALAGLITWYLSAKTLSDQYTSNESRVKNVKSKLNEIGSFMNHPNEEYEAGMQRLISSRRDSVRNAWNRKWTLLRDRLKWPREDLGEEFYDAVSDKLPIERVDKEDVDAIEFHLREQYRDFIKKEVPRLAEIVGARWVIEDRVDGGFGGDARLGGMRALQGGHDDEETVVDWFPDNQKDLIDNHFDWSHQQDNVPTSLQVLYAQEDLWVLDALLKIIKETNAGVTLKSQAAVKRIEHIHLGKNVAGPIVATAATDAEGGAAPGMNPGMAPNQFRGMGAAGGMRGMGAMGAMGAMGGMRGMGGMDQGIAVDPADGRYVDRNYQPLSADDLRSAAAADDAESAFLAVAKRMPINMRVSIDQRRIPELLVACANSVLTVEIRQLRFAGEEGSSGGGAARGMAAGGPMGAEAFGGGFGGGGMRRAMARPGADGSLRETLTWDVPIEIYGIIYIYNPVDLDKLGYVVENGYTTEVIEEIHALMDNVEKPAIDKLPADGPSVDDAPAGEEDGTAAEVASTSEVEGQPDG